MPERPPFAARFASPGWLLGLLALWLLCTLGLRVLLLPDEGRYANVAREMLSADMLVPTLNGLPFFHKPPLFYWLDMAAMQFLGLHAFGARMGAMLGAWLMGASLFFAVRRWQGARVAAIALGVLATCPFYFVGAQYANHDMLVAGLITAAVLALLRALEEPPRVQRGWLVAGAVACALAVLAKGLIGIVLPALVLGPWLLVQRRWRQIPGLLHPAGLLAFALVATPWFIVMQARFPGFFDYFFMEQHFRRFALTSFNNVQPFWFFIAVVPLLTLPWSVFLPQAIRRIRARRDARAGLYVWWVLAVLGFFSLPSSKIVGYALPALAPWCLLLALALAQLRAQVLRWALAGSALLCLLIAGVLAWQAPQSNRALALVLAARFAPADRVVMVDDYFYDIPFYAQLREPVIIASNWDDPALPRRDNWRKELFDAARFDPARGRALLRPLHQLDAVLCGSGRVWFVLRPAQAPRVQGLAGATRVLADAQVELWLVPAHACP